MDSNVLVVILGTGGASAIIAAIVTGLFSKRKLGAEATEIITKAAAGVVTNMQQEIDRQAKRYDETVAEHKQQITELVASHAAELEEMRRTLQLHVAWDVIVVAKMAEVGIDLPPAPPLLPARRFDHPHVEA